MCVCGFAGVSYEIDVLFLPAFQGAARMVLQGNIHPAQIKDAVSSTFDFSLLSHVSYERHVFKLLEAARSQVFWHWRMAEFVLRLLVVFKLQQSGPVSLDNLLRSSEWSLRFVYRCTRGVIIPEVDTGRVIVQNTYLTQFVVKSKTICYPQTIVLLLKLRGRVSRRAPR